MESIPGWPANRALAAAVAGVGTQLDSTVIAFVALLVASVVVGILVRKVPVPYVSALAVAGAILGTLGSRYGPPVTSSLILFIVLPGLLFESAFSIRWEVLKRDLVAVLVLVTAGIGVTVAVIAALGHAALGLSLPFAVLLGAAVAPTDPVAVVAIFRRLGVPERLATLVESESLLNDGTGVVVFGVALAAATGGIVTPASAALDFLRLAVGGIGLGLVVGGVLSRLTRHVDDEEIELTYTAIGAYGTYVLAEALGVSGILAVVATAMVLGNYGRTHGMSERTRAAVDTVWGYVAFLLNSVVFLMIGLSTPLASLWAHRGAILAASAIVLVARAVSVYVLLLPLRLLGRSFPWRWEHIVVWSGMRGAVAVALVLSLTERDSAAFETIRILVDGVVLLSIVVQGVTIRPLTSWLLPQTGSTTEAGTA